LVELLGGNASLTKDAAKRANSEFVVERHYASHGTLSRILAEHHVAASLPHLDETESL
jgi:hypothetical protein